MSHSCIQAPLSSTYLYLQVKTQNQSANLLVILLYFAKSICFVTLQMIKTELPQNHSELITYLRNMPISRCNFQKERQEEFPPGILLSNVKFVPKK